MGGAISQQLKTFKGLIERGWSWVGGLSLDVSLGALGTSLMVSRATGVSAPAAELCALWGAVSLIYTLDHILDAQSGGKAPTARRVFHTSHHHILCILCVLSGLTTLICLPFLSLLSWQLGGGLALCCALYLFVIQRTGVASAPVKKLIVGLLYPFGVCLPTFASLAPLPTLPYVKLGVLGGALVCVVSSNLLLFEVAERLTRRAPLIKAELWSACLNALALTPLCGSAVYCIKYTPSPYERGALITFSLMGLGLFVMNSRLQSLLIEERYRRLADGIFLLTWLTCLP